MTIHISQFRSGDATVLQIDGWLEGQDSDELLLLAGGSTDEVVLDLSDLRSADPPGLRAIRRLVAQGVVVRGLSDYLKLLLKRTSDTQERRP